MQIPYIYPYDWDGVLAFLHLRAIPHVEAVSEARYQRTIVIGGTSGILTVMNDEENRCLNVQVPEAFRGYPEEISQRCSALFATDVDVRKVRRLLGKDPALAPLVNRHAGLRLPGSWNSFEIIVRAIVGQQITVKAATTILGRIAAAYGDRIEGSDLNVLFPTPEKLASADFRGMGMPEKRCAAIRLISSKIAQGTFPARADMPLQEFVAALTTLPGIGTWTAHYIAMRGFGYTDAFPPGDVAVERAVSRLMGRKINFIQLQRRAESWRPWRSYAVVHLWKSL